MFAHALPEVSPQRTGFHVMWAGPHTWLYSPLGWMLQRRIYQRTHERPDCVQLSVPELTILRARAELPMRFGLLSYRVGDWVRPLAGVPAPTRAARIAVPPKCEVITLELNRPVSWISIYAIASQSFAVALRDGKVVAGGQLHTGGATHELAAVGIDTVILYVRAPYRLQYCERAEAPWERTPVIKYLQLPVRELMPWLADADAEYAEAKSRLLPGEHLDRDEFTTLADLIRTLVRADGPPRPIDLALIMRRDLASDFEAAQALDPIRTMLAHPRWRRVLGFAWFDRDPALIPGELYEYRVIGAFPRADLVDSVHGFHTTPAATALPGELYLDGVRVRLPQPTRIEEFGPRDGLRHVVRRGIRLAPRDQSWWQLPSLADWSAVIDLPEPVTSVILEVAPGHDLHVASGSAWTPPSAAVPLPPGPSAHLTFGAAVHQLRLAGTGFLHAVRIPRPSLGPSTPYAPLTATTVPARLLEPSPPEPPLSITVDNLQQPQVIATTDQPTGPAAPRHALGFAITWRPAAAPGVNAWPPDLDAAPLLEAALFQLEHSPSPPTATSWSPLLGDENYTMGDREPQGDPPQITPGSDLVILFPEIGSHTAGATDLQFSDVFDFDDSGADAPGLRRPVPAPGSEHLYRIRAVDAIGRPSSAWRVSAPHRLEKHLPPPLPAAPQLVPADALPLPEPSGVRARVLVRDAPDLTAEDRATLGTHANAIVLEWGWHDEQRKVDPFATEFRAYSTRRRLASVEGQLTSVTPVGPQPDRFDATIVLERAVADDIASGSAITAGKQFRVLDHDAGTTISAHLRAMEREADGSYALPTLGPVTLPVRVTPDQLHAPAWGPRLHIEPLDAREVYDNVVLYDLLDLSDAHPRDVILVGVSSADAQPYVPDSLTPARPGNESAIVPIECRGRWYGRPSIVEVPPLDPVPVIVTPEPTGRPLSFRLDLTPLLDAATPASGTRVALDRVADDDVFRAYRVDGDRVLATVPVPTRPGDVEQEVSVPSSDRPHIVAALSGADVDALADRYVVYLAASHPYRARLFRPVTEPSAPIPLGSFDETLPDRAARWVYRARPADASGRISLDGVTLRGVVRVPAIAKLAAPMLEPRVAGDPRDRLRLRVVAPRKVDRLVYFIHAAPRDGRPSRAELLRIPSSGRTPSDGLRVRIDDVLVSPHVKDLADPDVIVTGGDRLVTLDLGAAPGSRLRVWAAALTQDGVLSPLGGPWRVMLPPSPLVAPALSVAGTTPALTFSWTWPAAAEPQPVMLERAAPGASFERISAPIPRDRTSIEVVQPAGPWRYRLRVSALDGREAVGDEVVV